MRVVTALARLWASNILMLMAICMCINDSVHAQQAGTKLPRRDSAWVKDYSKTHIVLRVYESTKYNNFRFTEGSNRVIYNPNEHNNIGVGFTYKFLSINLGTHVAFVDRDYDRFGRTRQFDLQSHLYLPKLVVDFYAQYYKGFYLERPETVITGYTPAIAVKRPDISTTDLSMSFTYIFNNRRYSFSAPVHQTEIQMRSAGSLLAGGGLYNSAVRGDSTIIGSNIQVSNAFNNNRFRGAGTVGFGLNAGYGYTRVIRKQFFIGGAGTGGLGLNVSRMVLEDNANLSRAGLLVNFNILLAGGYNSGPYFAGITYVRLTTLSSTAVGNVWQEVNRGNLRVNLARRFQLPKKKGTPQSARHR